MSSPADPITSYNVEEEPIVLSKGLLDLLLKDERPAEVIGLYCFYYYTAKWQKTNQVRATTSYASQAMQWSEVRLRSVKKRLIDLGLISDVIVRGAKSRIESHYVRVHFIWSKNHTMDFPRSGFDSTVVNRSINALSTNNINALSTNNSSEKNQIPPKRSAVIAYIQERKSQVDPIAFYNFYMTKGWMVGKNKMKDWQAAVRTWERNDESKPAFNKSYLPPFKMAGDVKFRLCDDGIYRDNQGDPL